MLDRKSIDTAPSARPHLPLSFGEETAVECNSLLTFAENTRQVTPSLIDYDAARPAHFRSRSAVASINGLSLFAASLPNDRLQARVGGEADYTFGFHLSGECAFQVERSVLTIRPNISAVFLPADCPWVVDVASPSTTILSVKESRLISTLTTMLGGDVQQLIVPQFRLPAEVSLHFGQISFDHIFRGLCAQIDSYGTNQAMLDASGLDDVFYRTLALALRPEVFAKQSELPAVRIKPRRLDKLCQHIMARLGDRITLTDLERAGHMSRRTLHHAFTRAYGMSPMAWVREQRLLKARGLLSGRDAVRSVSEVLYACGFNNASQFAVDYARRFGELPSVTFKNKR